jgi:hypothetical protein
VLGNDSDPDSDPLTAVLGTDVSHGSLSLAADGGFTYTPTAGHSGPDSFTYTATDGDLSSGVATVTLTVAAPAGAIELVATSSASQKKTTSIVVARPTGSANGDLMLAAILAGSTATITPPSGWTSVVTTTSGTAIRQSVFIKVAGASEPASYTWTVGTASHTVGAIATYRGATTVDVAGGQGNAKATAITAPSVTTSQTGTLLVGIFGTAATTTIAPDLAMTELVEVPAPGTSKPTLELADQPLGGAGATGARVAIAGASARTIGQVIALRSTP